MIATKSSFEPQSGEPLPNCAKVYVTGKVHPDLQVPFRQINKSAEVDFKRRITRVLWAEGHTVSGLAATRHILLARGSCSSSRILASLMKSAEPEERALFLGARSPPLPSRDRISSLIQPVRNHDYCDDDQKID